MLSNEQQHTNDNNENFYSLCSGPDMQPGMIDHIPCHPQPSKGAVVRVLGHLFTPIFMKYITYSKQKVLGCVEDPCPQGAYSPVKTVC